MRLSTSIKAAAAGLSLALLAGCTGGDTGGQSQSGPVELTFWAWAPNIEKVVDRWNASHPDARVVVSKQAEGDNLVTKLLTAAKADNPPDLVQAEYQALPTLVSNDVLADIAAGAGSAKDKFPAGVWQQVTLGGEAVYAIPQDFGPMMFFYRSDLFDQYGLTVPKTWDEFTQTARAVRQKDPAKYLGTFSANDPGWFAGLAQQAGASWWSVQDDTWKVSVDDAATRKLAEYWQGLVAQDIVDDQPMYTPEWNKALNEGTQIGWISAVWAPGVLAGNAPATQGKWAMAPLPQWDPTKPRTGNWGGSTTGVTAKSRNQKAATEFALWLNTDPAAVDALVTDCSIYPAASAAQTGSALQKPPAFMTGQPDFYARAKAIAGTAAEFTFGPNVNVTYATYKDAFSKAITQKTPFGPAIAAMQQSTVDDMRKNGFKVSS